MVSETGKSGRESEGKAKGIEGPEEIVVDTRGLTKRWTGARYASFKSFEVAECIYSRAPGQLGR